MYKFVVTNATLSNEDIIFSFLPFSKGDAQVIHVYTTNICGILVFATDVCGILSMPQSKTL